MNALDILRRWMEKASSHLYLAIELGRIIEDMRRAGIPFGQIEAALSELHFQSALTCDSETTNVIGLALLELKAKGEWNKSVVGLDGFSDARPNDLGIEM